MSLPGFLTAAAASWAILACVVAVPIGRAMRRADDTQPPQYPPPIAPTVNWLPFLPPVPTPVTPPFTQAIPDASWFDGMPVEILSDEAVHSLFDRLVELDDNLRDLA